MKTIWKYPIEITDTQKITVPGIRRFMNLLVNNGVPCLYYLVDTRSEHRDVTICIYGTGSPIEGVAGEYLGSFNQSGFSLVWHVFQK